MLIKSIVQRSIPLLSAAALMCLAANAQEQQAAVKPSVHPVPQQIKLAGGKINASLLTVNALSKDSDTLRVIAENFKTGANGFPVTMGLASHPQLTKLAAGMQKKSGAYKLLINKNNIIIIGADSTGMFYGAQTLAQLAQKTAQGEVSLPMVLVNDWPDVRFRGTVEGFYGPPWSFEARASQFEFYGKYKFNTYIYGPKDDPYHGFSNKWREPYPADQAKKLAELITIAKRNKVNFIWAMHPGRDIKWGEADRTAALKKFQMMYDLGVRSFGVFFDDIGGTAGEPEGQVEFLNYLNREFVRKKKDVTPLVMCPTAYSGGGGKYHDILGDKLDKDIDVMWTGMSIVNDITIPGLKNIDSHLKRSVYIWWNFPVTDYIRHALFIGRVYGLEKGSQDLMSGFVSNPMDKPEASKITLFSIADFTWNQNGFDSVESWHASIRKQFPRCAASMQTFANHNSDAGPSVHNYRRAESEDIAPVVEKVLQAAKSGENISAIPETAALTREFANIAKAPADIRKNAGNPRLIEEISPWLDIFEELGKAGTGALKINAALQNKDAAGALSAALAAADGLYHMDKRARDYAAYMNNLHRNDFYKAPRVGSLIMTPAVKEMTGLWSGSAIAAFTGRPVNVRRPYLSTTFLEGIDKMLDNDPQSFYYCKEVLKVGDYFGLDLGSVQEIRNVHLVMGRNDGDTDAVNKGQLETSADGKKWIPLPGPTSGLNIDYSGAGIKGRFVRYRCTQAGVPGGKPDVWTAIRDFKVNTPAPPALVTNVNAFKTLPLEESEQGVSIKQMFEIASMKPKETLGIVIPDGANVESAVISLKTPDLAWAAVEVTRDGTTWTKVNADKQDDRFNVNLNTRIMGIRLTNIGKGPREVYLQEFKLNYPAGSAASQVSKLFDDDLVSRIEIPLNDENFTIPCSIANAAEAVILSDGVPAEVYALGADGKWTKAGAIKEGERLNRINLAAAKAPIASLRLKGASGKTTTVAEILWK